MYLGLILQIIFASLAVVGCICVFITIYDAMLRKCSVIGDDISLVIKIGSDKDNFEQVMLSAERIRELYFPHMEICVEDMSGYDERIEKILTNYFNVTYISNNKSEDGKL